MVEIKKLCENHSLKNNLMSFGTFFFLLFKNTLSNFSSPKVKPLQPWRPRTGSPGCPVRQPWRARAVTVRAPSAPFIAGGQEKVPRSLLSVQEPVPPCGETLGDTSFCQLGNKRGRRGLHIYPTGPPRLPYRTSRATGTGPPRLQGSNFWRRKMRKKFFFDNLEEKKVCEKCQKTSSHFLLTDFNTNFHFQPLNPFNDCQ